MIGMVCVLAIGIAVVPDPLRSVSAPPAPSGPIINLDDLTDPVEIVRVGDVVSSNFQPVGGRYDRFYQIQLNNNGQLAFHARLTDTDEGELDDTGLYEVSVNIGTGFVPLLAPVVQIFREGDSISIGDEDYTVANLPITWQWRLQDRPLLPPDLIGPAALPRLGIAALLNISDPPGPNLVLRDDQDRWQLVARNFEPAPTEDGDLILSTGKISAPYDRFQQRGFTFQTDLFNTPGGNTDDRAIYRFEPPTGGQVDSLRQVARTGSLSGGNSGELIAGISGLQGNASGSLVFYGENDSDDPDTSWSIYFQDSASETFRRVFGAEDFAPSEGLEAFRFQRAFELTLNNNDHMGFRGLLIRDDPATGFPELSSGLYVATPFGAITEVVAEGQPRPNDGGPFPSFRGGGAGPAAFNQLNQFAFRASDGVFLASADGTVELAREGNLYEGNVIDRFFNPMINDQGLVLIRAILNVGTIPDPDPDGGIITLQEEVLILTDGVDYATVARQGQEIGSQVVDDILGYEMNDHGAVVLVVRFENVVDAILRWRPRWGWRSAAGDGVWDNPANWTFSLPPNLDSNVVIEAPTDIRVAGPEANTQVNSLWLGQSLSAVTAVVGEGAITTTEGLMIGPNGVLEVAENKRATLGGPVFNDGVIQVDDGGQLVIAGLLAGNGRVSGVNGTVVIEGGIAPGR
ncbi:MAG: choice-of-anchor tandem repeat NxxGxxAF-containing protein [Pseudomonadota bacterium]